MSIPSLALEKIDPTIRVLPSDEVEPCTRTPFAPLNAIVFAATVVAEPSRTATPLPTLPRPLRVSSAKASVPMRLLAISLPSPGVAEAGVATVTPLPPLAEMTLRPPLAEVPTMTPADPLR